MIKFKKPQNPLKKFAGETNLFLMLFISGVILWVHSSNAHKSWHLVRINTEAIEHIDWSRTSVIISFLHATYFTPLWFWLHSQLLLLLKYSKVYLCILNIFVQVILVGGMSFDWIMFLDFVFHFKCYCNGLFFTQFSCICLSLCYCTEEISKFFLQLAWYRCGNVCTIFAFVYF